jgi:hypothetical protein
MMVTLRPGFGQWGIRHLRFIGADPHLTEVRGALCEPAFERSCYAALREDICARTDDLHWIQWTGIGTENGACEALEGHGLRWEEGVACYVLDLPRSWKAFYDSRARSFKKSLRHCYNSLKRDGLEFALEVATKSSEAAPALADFFRLHAARAAQGRTARPNIFRDSSFRAFLLDVCSRFAERDALRIFRLYVGNRLVATRIGFVLGNCLYLYYSGFDPAFTRYYVMTTTVAEAIRWAIDHGITSVNLSSGADESKLRWGPREVRYREATLVRSPALGSVTYKAVQALGRSMSQAAARGLGLPTILDFKG